MKMFRGRPWVFVVALTVVAAALFLGLRGVAAQDGAAVNIIDFAFEPATVEIPVGARLAVAVGGGVV